ncbi:MAG: BON domain-containing protein [Pseudomonadales bacterium]
MKYLGITPHGLPAMPMVALLFSISLVISACTGAYRDPQARTIGDVTDDLAIGTKVKSKLLADGQVSGLRINVDVHQGVVTLRGPVPTEALGTHAAALAAGIKGVERVENLTRVND